MDKSIISSKMQRRMNKIRKQKAKLQSEEKSFVEDFYKENDKETVAIIIDVAGKYCHNYKEKAVSEIQKKYAKKEEMRFDDLVVLYEICSSFDEKGLVTNQKI